MRGKGSRSRKFGTWDKRESDTFTDGWIRVFGHFSFNDKNLFPGNVYLRIFYLYCIEKMMLFLNMDLIPIFFRCVNPDFGAVGHRKNSYSQRKSSTAQIQVDTQICIEKFIYYNRSIKSINEKQFPVENSCSLGYCSSVLK